jgi:hypothetical protein
LPLIGWARSAGEAADYTDNLPLQCLHPVGHWYEVPNLLRNGVLAELLIARPQLKHLMLHNIDTLGADVDEALLGIHIRSRACLTREEIVSQQEETIAAAVRRMAAKMPTYVTLKEVKKRWGHGHEDIFPVTQFEKLWVDMTALPQIACQYVVVPRMRGQQLKDQAQLDGWLRDGSAAYVEALCDWN